jgi:hypothetical protein
MMNLPWFDKIERLSVFIDTSGHRDPNKYFISSLKKILNAPYCKLTELWVSHP